MYALNTYLVDRFPLGPLLAFGLALSMAISTVNTTPILSTNTIWATLYLISFLFHLRVLDEHKDHPFDQAHHPERPTASGKTPLSFLRYLNTLNLTIFMGIAIFTTHSLVATLLSIVALMYSFLMYFNFFAPKMINQSPLLTLITHQIVIIPIYLVMYSLILNKVWFPQSTFELLHILYLLIPAVLIEIGRKMAHRTSPSGSISPDSYAYAWGDQPAVWVFASLLLLAATIGMFLPLYSPLGVATLLLLASCIYYISYTNLQLITSHHIFITMLSTFTITLLPLIPA